MAARLISAHARRGQRVNCELAGMSTSTIINTLHAEITYTSPFINAEIKIISEVKVASVA